MKKQKKPKIILYDSYIQTIRNGIGSNLFRNLYARVGGKKVDILRDGDLSCAVFVSSVLYLFKLIFDVHATVDGTIADLKRSGWKEIFRPQPGAVLVWQSQKFKDGSEHKHIGFYIDKDRAISNNNKNHKPALHHWTFGIKNGQPGRKIEQILWKKIK